MPIENIEVVHGDTNKIPFGMGTYGSRSLAVGGSALVKALDKIITKAKRIAAHLMEANRSPTSSSRTASSPSPARTSPCPSARWR